MMLFRVIRGTFQVLFLYFLLVSANEDDIRNFLGDVLRYAEEIQRGGTDSFVYERLYGELRDHVHTLSGLLSVLRSGEDRSNQGVGVFEWIS